MMKRNLELALLMTLLAAYAFSQQPRKLLTNLDVIKMVKGGLPESVVVSSIQSRPSKFDVSPDGLIALHKAGVTQSEMDAIMTASGMGTPTPAATAASGEASALTPASTATAATPSIPKSHLPKVTVTQAGVSQELPLEKTQLAQTKTKPTSMKSLAGDSVVTQSMQAGIGTATMGMESHMTSAVGGSMVQQAGSIFSSALTHRKPTLTYAWGVPNPASTNVLQVSSPEFSVDFSTMRGITPDDFEPAIVKLTPAQNTCRIVGATQGKEDVQQSPAADWQIYSSFLEERVKVNSDKAKPGQFKISPTSPLLPGEYAIVLRPVSKSKKFSGADVARAQGDGLMFDAVWSFQISPEAD